MERYKGVDVALNKANIEYRPQEKKYLLQNTGWMSAPSIAQTHGGRLWLTVNLGGADEGSDNMLTVSKSDDEGKTWEECVFAISHQDKVRIHEPLVWATPEGRIFVSWIQSYVLWDGRGGLWISEILEADSDIPVMTEPYRVCDGVMATCPAYTQDGKWILPIANWKSIPGIFSDPDMKYSMMYISSDQGKTVELIGKADVPQRTFDEHSIVMLSEQELLMTVRTLYGSGFSKSYDGGKTWTEGKEYYLAPSAKSCMRNLPDGRLLWITYDSKRRVRERITAMISDDNGETWKYRLLLDDRENVSYPDVHVRADGIIYITHDYDRKGAKEVVLHKVAVEDIVQGKLVSEGGYIGRKAFIHDTI